MDVPHFLSITEQVAAHLKDELERAQPRAIVDSLAEVNLA
jgi:hypothetical protein